MEISLRNRKEGTGAAAPKSQTPTAPEQTAPDPEQKLKAIMGLPPEKPIDKPTIQNFLAANGIKQDEVSLDDYDSIIRAVQMIKGQKEQDPRAV